MIDLRFSLTLGFFGLQNSKNPIHQMIYEYMDKRRDHVLVKTYQEAVQRVMDSNYAFIGESISQDLAAARHCNLIRAPEVIGARGFGIATAQGQSLRTAPVPLLCLDFTGLNSQVDRAKSPTQLSPETCTCFLQSH